jgi:acyl carrier protein
MHKLITLTIAENLAIDPQDVTPQASLKDNLGADSLDLIEIFNILEEETGKQIPKDSIREATTVQDIVDLLGGNSGND